MTNEKDREMPRCTLSDEALADKLTEWAIKLAKTGGGAWGLRVPVDLNHDPDILMIEAADRVRIRAEAVKAERKRCELIVTEEILEYDCDFTGLVNNIVSRILSSVTKPKL